MSRDKNISVWRISEIDKVFLGGGRTNKQSCLTNMAFIGLLVKLNPHAMASFVHCDCMKEDSCHRKLWLISSYRSESVFCFCFFLIQLLLRVTTAEPVESGFEL